MGIKRVTTEYEIYSGGLAIFVRPHGIDVFIEQDSNGKVDRVYVEHDDIADLIKVLVEIQDGHD